MSKNSISVLRENLKLIEDIKSKNFSNPHVCEAEIEQILKVSYFQHLMSNLLTNAPYREVYRLNQMLNSITPFFRNIQSKGNDEIPLENVLEDNDRMTLRFISSFHMLFGEIQMLMEQDYQLQAFGRLRLVLELYTILDICYENDEMYMDGLEFGNFHWGKYENWFGPKISDEAKSFDSYMKNKYSENNFKNIYYWIQKNTGEQFVASKEFKKRNKDDEILMFSWKMCHNFNHAGSMLLALDDKPGLYDSMSKYANQMIMYSIFKVARYFFDKLKNIRTKEIDDIMYRLKLKPFYKIIKEVDEYINDVLKTEQIFIDFINKRRESNK